MQKFIANTLLFMLPIVVFGLGMEASLRNIPNDYQYKRTYLDENSDRIEVLFLGNSHAYRGINPEFISRRSFNASYVSQSLDYDYAILKKYDGKWNSLDYIVIPISYFSLYFRLETGGEAWRAKNYSIYYDLRLSNRIADNSEFLSNQLSVNFRRIYSYYFLGRPNISCSALGFGKPAGPRRDPDLEETAKRAAVRQTAKPNDRSYDRVFIENAAILEDIFRFAGEREIRVILYTLPGSHPYVEQMDKRQLNRTIAKATELANLYTNVIYVNWLNDKSFTEADFWDGDHLNETGAEKLTKKIDLLLASQ